MPHVRYPVRTALGSLILLAGLVAGPAPATATPVHASRAAPGAAFSSATADIDAYDRDAVISGYRSRWMPARTVPFSWTGGDIRDCRAGTPAHDVVQANLDAVNFARDLAGVDPVVLTPAWSGTLQQTALLMEANMAVSHNPPQSWTCWTQAGYDGAGVSNLVAGEGGGTVRGVEIFLSDWGPGNESVGHRNWVLSPAISQIGLGLTPNAQAMQVIGGPYDHDAADRLEQPVGWPTPGYFPEPLLPDSDRWSFNPLPGQGSVNHASVSLTRLNPDGTTTGIPVTVEHRSPGAVTFMVPDSLTTASDIGDDLTYRIRLTDVQTGTGQPAPDITYTVTLVRAAHDPVPWSTRPAVADRPLVGIPVTVDRGAISPHAPADRYRYTWMRGRQVVGTGQAYTPTAEDHGHRLAVEVKVLTPAGQVHAATLVETQTVGFDAPPHNTTAPTVTGRAEVGSTLSLTAGSWTPPPASYGYAWTRDGTPIPGATHATYVVTGQDAGTTLHAQVTGYSDTGRPATAASAAVDVPPIEPEPEPTAPQVIVKPQLTGAPQVGKTISGTVGTWRDATTFALQWLRDGTPIAGATRTSYRVTIHDLAAPLALRVTATGPTGLTTHATSLATTPVRAGQPVGVTVPGRITGNPRPGRWLRLVPPRFDTRVSQVRHQWLRNGRPISAATARSYRLARSDRGARFRVATTASKPGHRDRIVTTPAVRIRR